MQKMPINTLKKRCLHYRLQIVQYAEPFKMKNWGLRHILFLAFGLLLPFLAYSQSNVVVKRPSGTEYWFLLKEAQENFESASYGKSLGLAEEAKEKRRAQTAWESYIMDQSLRLSAVRNAGDLIADILPVLKQRKQTSACEIVENYLTIYGESYFSGSFSRLLNYLHQNDVYPEADYLIGRVYKVEGELEIAIQYMEKAYNEADRLDVPDVKFDILYDLADIARLQNNGNENYEKYMLTILAADKNFTNEGYMNAVLKIIQGNSREAVDRFFMLYRSDNDISLKALEGLASYYRQVSLESEEPVAAERNRIKALRCAALGTVVAVTKIESTVKDRINNFNYTNMPELLSKAGLYSDVVEWGNSNGVWELFVNFGVQCSESGYPSFARRVFEILKNGEPEEYWRQKAASHIKADSSEKKAIVDDSPAPVYQVND